MKKKIIAFAAIMAIAVSMSGCGKDKEKKSNITDLDNVTATMSADGAAASGEPESKTEEQVKEELDNFAKDADKNADMDKIDGNKLKGEGGDKADLDGYQVEIKDAVKATDADGSGVIVVEYSFKNNTASTTKFDSVLKSTAAQNGKQLPVAVTYEAEGYDILTIAQDVESGDKITVQKAFKLTSDTDAVEITVRRTDTAGTAESVVKTFSLQ
ncbi:MAG: DUF5067 domain-containing protein [bacterium]|nr:DUF5067 domain-containing protein [bacterium]